MLKIILTFYVIFDLAFDLNLLCNSLILDDKRAHLLTTTKGHSCRMDIFQIQSTLYVHLYIFFYHFLLFGPGFFNVPTPVATQDLRHIRKTPDSHF